MLTLIKQLFCKHIWYINKRDVEYTYCVCDKCYKKIRVNNRWD